MYPLNNRVPPAAYTTSMVLLKPKIEPTRPVISSAMRPPKSQGPRPEKSYLDWKVNKVRPRKTPRVMRLRAEASV